MWLVVVLDVGRRGLTEDVQDTLWEDDASMPPPLRVGHDNDFKEQKNDMVRSSERSQIDIGH
jgi:hypothetical protein